MFHYLLERKFKGPAPRPSRLRNNPPFFFPLCSEISFRFLMGELVVGRIEFGIQKNSQINEGFREVRSAEQNESGKPLTPETFDI